MRNGRSDRAVQGSEGGTRTLTLTAVTRNSFIEEHTKLTTTTPDRALGLWLEPGDVLVQRSNTPELVGTSARYQGPRDWAIFPDLLIRLRADESLVDSRFLSAALRSRQGHAQLRRRAKGAAGSMPKIDQETIGSALIPVPSGDDQRRIVAQVANAETGLRRLRTELEAAQQRSAALRRSLLAAAFSGRLTEASAST
jgi:type I restriction enzyme S subunit